MCKSDGRIHASNQRPFKPSFQVPIHALNNYRFQDGKFLKRKNFIQYTKEYGENKNLRKEYTRACALDRGPRRLAGGFLRGADKNN